jgi:hypothetical protein
MSAATSPKKRRFIRDLHAKLVRLDKLDLPDAIKLIKVCEMFERTIRFLVEEK